MENLGYVDTDVKKELYKTKVMANFSHIADGSAFYTVEYNGGLYQFPLELEETKIITINLGEDIINSFNIKVPSADMKGATFGSEVKGASLSRWVSRAIKNGNFIKIG